MRPIIGARSPASGAAPLIRIRSQYAKQIPGSQPQLLVSVLVEVRGGVIQGSAVEQAGWLQRLVDDLLVVPRI